MTVLVQQAGSFIYETFVQFCDIITKPQKKHGNKFHMYYYMYKGTVFSAYITHIVNKIYIHILVCNRWWIKNVFLHSSKRFDIKCAMHECISMMCLVHILSTFQLLAISIYTSYICMFTLWKNTKMFHKSLLTRCTLWINCCDNNVLEKFNVVFDELCEFNIILKWVSDFHSCNESRWIEYLWHSFQFVEKWLTTVKRYNCNYIM